ncbi:C2H2-type domain-containing protein [Meloidogyne graminicola]|uniref:C2H2-type domain-containing protein n=1 Tax=Meloidogyne graminicola TaxID=189291 RepID=A0A8S9ZYH7_9BILA|nr:C2H2-type domain-containing protein [Meloidogyne graminicola]
MFHQNCCTFAKIEDGKINSQGEKCGLYYKNLLELIHHIEEEHIPLIENAKTIERRLLREQFINEPEQYEKAKVASFNQPLPLSLVCKLKPFPKGHKVFPIAPPKQRILKFSHYKPKSIIQQFTTNPNNNVKQPKDLSEILEVNDQVSFSAQTSRRISENQHNRLRETSTSSGIQNSIRKR